MHFIRRFKQTHWPWDIAQHQSMHPPPWLLAAKARTVCRNEKKAEAPSSNFMAAEASSG